MLLLGILQANAQIAMPDTVCVGITRLYHVNDPTISSVYTWKIDGTIQMATTNQINITWNTPGIFSLSVQEHPATGCDGDIRSGLVYVNPPPVANAGLDISACFGKNIQINGSGGKIYQWSPSTYLSASNIPNPLIISAPPGLYNYYLSVSSVAGCRSLKNDTVTVLIKALPNVFAGRDTSIALNEPLQLNAIDINNAGIISYSWSPSFGLNNPLIKTPIAITDRDIIYTVTVNTAEDCQGSDDIKVKVFQRADLYVPTAFTPNGDGLNDFAIVIPVGIRELKYFSIFSRWGEMVFTTNDASKGWNGKWKGDDQPNAVFVWMAQAIDYKGNIINKKGTVTLIR